MIALGNVLVGQTTVDEWQDVENKQFYGNLNKYIVYEPVDAFTDERGVCLRCIGQHGDGMVPSSGFVTLCVATGVEYSDEGERMQSWTSFMIYFGRYFGRYDVETKTHMVNLTDEDADGKLRVRYRFDQNDHVRDVYLMDRIEVYKEEYRETFNEVLNLIEVSDTLIFEIEGDSKKTVELKNDKAKKNAIEDFKQRVVEVFSIELTEDDDDEPQQD